ncbi:MAG: GGDEF domain-containing protein [Roseovarius sp.]|uniref:GGDEF domain-containing protein n=1 Tax=Roseovarius sp. TaxID=1486281 RepID=UPI0032EDE4C4
MRLHLKHIRDVRVFAAAVTVVALAGNFVLHSLMYPRDLDGELLFAGSVITVSLALPISFFIGLRMRDIYRLTIRLEVARDHDPLTGALTRAAFHSRAAGLVGAPATLIICDIDHFKAFNDRFGHLAGDAALRHVVEVLGANCRKGDLIARFGGEEFLMLLPGTTPEEGGRVAQRLCERLRVTPVPVDGTERPVTASFGVAEVRTANDLVTAIARADGALYAAKDEGRNRVCRA